MWFCLIMVLGLTDERVKRARAEWAEVAPDLGLDASAYRSKLIWQKDEPGRSHVVIRLKGPRALILKKVFKSPADAELLATVTAQQAAFDGLRSKSRSHAPEVLYVSPDATCVVMTEARGKTLNDHLEAGRNHTEMLRRAGGWLANFHGSAPLEKRTYQPKFMVGHVARMAKAVQDGDMTVAEPELFLACCDRIPDHAEQVEGQATQSATKHGDFNMRNILLGPDGETGLDFKPASQAPVGFDIARLLMDYAELFQPQSDVKPGQVLSEQTTMAFFSGYTVVRHDDPSVRFVPFVQLLNDWRLIPPAAGKRSWRQRARFDGIVALAQNAFGLK